MCLDIIRKYSCECKIYQNTNLCPAARGAPNIRRGAFVMSHTRFVPDNKYPAASMPCRNLSKMRTATMPISRPCPTCFEREQEVQRVEMAAAKEKVDAEAREKEEKGKGKGKDKERVWYSSKGSQS